MRFGKRLLCVAGILLGCLAGPAPAQVVISQVYGGGGNAGSTWRQDFIELHNNGGVPVPINGWSVQYASASGTTWQMTVLNGVIPPGGYYLIQEAQGAGGTSNIPAPQAVGTIPMSATAGKVALVNNSVLLVGSCPLGSGVMDFVGFGAANCFEGGGPTGAPSNTTAVLRNANGCQDTNNNATDFAVGPPNPRNASSPPVPCGPPVLSRAQAASFLLAPSSGVPIDLAVSNVWCPPSDFGGGMGFEGLMPPGTRIEPGNSTGGPGMTSAAPAYLFWIDDLTDAEFAHPVRFALMDATNPSPSVSNGGIVVSDEHWWPLITLPLGVPTPYFRLLADQATANPAGPSNDRGLIGGTTFAPADIMGAPAPAPAGNNNRKWGLVLIGDDREDFQNDAVRHKNDLKRQGCPEGNITTAGVGGALTKQQFCDAIDNFAMMLMNLTEPCDKIFIRISTHGLQPAPDGSGRGITVKDDPNTPAVDDFITSAELCMKLKKLGKGGVPVCIVINACFSGGLVDAARWDFPAGSSIITSADGSNSSYGGTYGDGTGMFTGSAFQYALTTCGEDNRADADMNGTVDECEAFNWVRTQRPCYTFKGNNTMTYPGGRPDAVPMTKPDQNAQKFTVGVNGKSMNYNARNGTGANKSDFHIIFKGDVRGGTARSWRSNANDQIGAAWDFDPMITYDPTTDTTMVCYENLDSPVANGDYIHFGYHGAGKPLRVVRHWWTPTGDPPANADRAPASGTSVQPGMNGDPGTIRIINRTTDADGWGEPIFVQPSYWLSPVEVELVQLNLTSLNSTLGPPTPLAPLVVLPPDHLLEVPIPFDFPPPGMHLILSTQVGWELNSTIISQLDQFDPITLLPGCVADVDDGSFTGTPDGGVTIDDLLYYLFIFEAGDSSADVDDGSFTGTLDGGVTIDDLLYYLFRFEAGC